MKEKGKIHSFTFYFSSPSSTAPKAFSLTNCAAVNPVIPVIFIRRVLAMTTTGYAYAVFLGTHPSIHPKA
ncbi:MULTISPECIES: hypothetical protein [unclassified Nostoc]|uniref:hypothetical protein n=1 Tax=unclassified Nostoc TaxID=2593658 RepID=UPI002AD1DD47|nr:hypothetical protein [Nostoc sp. ChiQUE02]